jgi:hypothetical protein
MNRVFVDIYSKVGSNIQDTSTSTATLIKSFCNDIYMDILRRINWDNIDDAHTFTTTAGVSDYVLQQNFGKEVYVMDNTNKVQLSPISLQEMVRDYPDAIGQTGKVTRYTILSKPVRNQPTSSSTLAVVSASASDTTQTVYIVGRDSGTAEISESVTLNGTTTVTTTNTFSEIRSITKSAGSTGRVTITSNGGANIVAIMSPADKAYSIKSIRLNYTPDSVITIAMPYIMIPYPLSSDYDQPVVDCATSIELGATMMAWRYKRQFSKANEYERQYERSLDTLVWNKENSFNKPVFIGTTPYSRADY